ncbi:MAG: SMP-30/gluconolactonase/LRE family protein [Anaerolineae bacterium]|nr:SMP-30/gluconolactonase/LRE family protein [Anaerolineae bacterium]
MQPKLIADYQCQVGENPLWHPMEHCLYWCDITSGRLFRYDPATSQHEQCYSGEPIGGFTIQADGALLLFMARGSIATWRDGRLDTIVDEIPDERESRFNDVIADPIGRVFCGTMPTPTRLGRLYRLDLDGSLHVILDGIGTSNGMGFTLDHRAMYYTDTKPRNIYLFDYDSETGALSNQRVWLHIAGEDEGAPDGLTVDAEGYVWSARWDGSALYRYSPDGVVDRRIDFPAKKVTCMTFGGDDLADLYVTTGIIRGTKATEGEGAGALFKLQPGVNGLPEFFSRIKL